MSELAAPATPNMRGQLPSLPATISVRWLIALIGVLALMQLSMATGRSINWDEFWFYSQVELVSRGEFIQPLQTIHTRFFFWLPDMPGSEIDHILIARLFMWGCALVTSGGIYLLAEKFSDRRTALLTLAAFMGAGYVMQHSSSFRVDPIVTALLTSALVLAARTRLGIPAIIALGALIGLAAMVTIKFVLWAPAFAGIALWRWSDEGYDWRYAARWIAAGAAALGVFALLYALHSVDSGAQQSNEVASGVLSRSSSKMFALFNSPHLPMIGKGVFTALPLTFAILLVPSTVLRLDLPLTKRIALLALWFPVLTPLFYLNSLPYFYPFILPPVAVTCALTIPIFVKRYGMALVAGFIGLSAAMVWVVDTRGVTVRQQQLVSAVHEVFPQPVNYFDCCGMIGTFAKQNEFLTQYGVQKYLAAGEPALLIAMQAKPVPLVLDNNRHFSALIERGETANFHPEDARALRQTYVRFWADIYVAGRVLDAGTAQEWDILVPGAYTAEGTLEIDGTIFADGSIIELDRGTVSLANNGEETARLIWGRNPQRPEIDPVGFYWTAW